MIGQDEWKGDVTLKFTKGDDCLPTRKTFPVPKCEVAALCELSAMIQTPEKPGRYTAYFRLTRDEVFFGPRIWVDIHVVKGENELLDDNDEQTQKRLERLDKQQSILRESPMKIRKSTERNRNSTPRRSKRKTNMDGASNGGGLGMVAFPVRIPKASSNQEPTEKNYPQQLENLRTMGFTQNEAELKKLLNQYDGNVERVVAAVCT